MIGDCDVCNRRDVPVATVLVPGEPRACFLCQGDSDPDPYGELKVMTPAQYIKAIEKLGLNQVEAGEFLGVTGRQSRRWIAGDSEIPESVGKLLRLMIRLDLKPEDVK